MTNPVLYSYRRCPYAMRARMALKYTGIDVEIREISLRHKPKQLVAISPKATVPVLVLPDGQVIDESLDIIYWALDKQDTGGWLADNLNTVQGLIAENDTTFKAALDRYKYADRHLEKTQAEHRAIGEVFLQKLESLLEQNNGLLGAQPTLADIAIFPFVRQFRGVDITWFETAPYPKLNAWLTTLIESALFASIMQKHPTYIE